MKEERDYIQDISEIRSMMERSSKFLSLSGLSGILAGLYALAGAWVAWRFLDFYPDQLFYSAQTSAELTSALFPVGVIAIAVLVLAVGTAILFSRNYAREKGQQIWNITSRRLLASMSVPLVSGGILLLIFASQGLLGLLAPTSMIFYGIAIYNGSKFTYDEMKYLGLMQILLGLIASWFVEYGLLFWALGFGVLHVVYGIFMHLRYER